MGEKLDDTIMSWMDDQEYLAAWKAEHEASSELPAQERSVAARPGCCPACRAPVAHAAEPPLDDRAHRRWHRECARQALGRLATAHPTALCPGCGERTAASGFLFDAARRKWHVAEACTARALAEI